MADHLTTTMHEPVPDMPAPQPATENGSNGVVEVVPAIVDGVSADDATEAGALAEVAQPDYKQVKDEPAPSTDTTTTTTTTTTTPPQPPSDDQIVDAMRGIIKSNDVGEITLRVLMGLLEKEFQQELTSRKGFVKEKIGILLAEQQSGEADASEEVEVGGEGDDAEVDEEPEADAEANGDEGAEEESEETLNMSKEDMEVQRLLMEQIKFGTGRVTRGRTSGREPPKPFKPKKRKSTENEEGKQEGEDGEEPKKKKKKGSSRTNRPKNLSPALGEFLGETEMTRPDVVKRLHLYIKEHNLQNPKNKKQILFDDKLQQVFKRKTTDYFKLNTLLTKHLTDPGELL